MARFSFRKRNAEEEGLPEEEEADLIPSVEESGGSGRARRFLIIFGIGVVLLGGAYLAKELFLAPPPPPSPPPLAVARPTPPTPAPAPPVQEAAPTPAAPASPPAKEETESVAPPNTAPSPPASSKTEAPRAPAAQTEAKAPAKAPGAAPGIYSLQVGAMVMQENAETLKQKLDASGFPASIRKGTAFVSKQIVSVGEPTSRSEAEGLARRLNVDGFPSQLIEVAGKYTPQIGAFFNLNEAIDLSRELQKKNYPPKITSKPANTVVFQVRHGRFGTRAAAVKRGEELKRKGYSFMVVRD